MEKIGNTEVLNNVEFNTDHRMVRATIFMENIRKTRKNFSSNINSSIPNTCKLLIQTELSSQLENEQLNNVLDTKSH